MYHPRPRLSKSPQQFYHRHVEGRLQYAIQAFQTSVTGLSIDRPCMNYRFEQHPRLMHLGPSNAHHLAIADEWAMLVLCR